MVSVGWLSRRLHLSRPLLRSGQKSRTAKKSGNVQFQRINGGKPQGELVIPSIPEVPRTLSGSELTPQDIKSISDDFLSRTKDLEPGMDVKELPQIREEFHDRYGKRYYSPSKEWFEKSWRDRKVEFNKALINSDFRSRKIKQLNEYRPSELMSRPLDVGDLVLLKSHPSELCMCIDLPSSTKDPRYTFTTVDGSLKFGTRSLIILRIPHSLPSQVSEEADLLLKEAKHGYEPVGTIKNKAHETLLLPIVTRQLVTSFAAQNISKEAWEQLPLTLKKLEFLHRRLQDSHGPHPVPFFTLVKMVQSLDLTKAISSQDGKVYVSDLIRDSAATANSVIKSSISLATFWAIEAQQKAHLWGEIQSSRALLSPISVMVLPFVSQHVFYTNLKEELKANGYEQINNFSRLVNEGKFNDVTESFPKVIQLLKDYAAGNFQSDETIISLISKIFRKIESFKDHDITRDTCGELLSKASGSTKPRNPIHSSFSLNLPDCSQLTKLNEKVYELSKPVGSLSNENRFDFGDLRVYCIDSEDAHEIDDGVSIEDHGAGNYTLHIHIADPAALFSESSDKDISGIRSEILKLAFERCFTTYLPDTVVPMLPKAYCKAADLGIHGKKTKTITFSIDTIVAPDGNSIKLLYETYEVRLSEISNFPRVTYDIVDEYLDNGTKSRTSSPIHKDLQSMLKVSQLLRKSRINNDDAVVFGNGFNKGLVALSPVDQEISFFDQKETNSNLLVSELMILANTLAGRYFAQNSIPGVFRCYQALAIRDEAHLEYEKMKRNIKANILPSTKDINLLSSLLNSSFYNERPVAHEMIGASQYLTVTSPLRRFPDIINHLQIHRILRGLPLCFSEVDISKLLWHIQSRDATLKKAASHQASYWTLKYLKEVIKDAGSNKFGVTITSVPQFSVVRCVLSDFPAARGTLKLKPNIKSIPVIGDTIKDCRISKIDCLDSLLELEL